MNRALTDFLVEMPILYSLLLRVTAVLFLAWAGHYALSSRNPRWRVYLWRTASLAICLLTLTAALPKFDIPLFRPLAVKELPKPSRPRLAARANISAADRETLAQRQNEFAEETEPLSSFLQEQQPREVEIAQADPDPVMTVSRPSVSPQWQRYSRYVLGLCWGLGAVFCLTRWIVAQRQVRTLLQTATSAPSRYRKQLLWEADRLDLQIPVELRVSPQIDVPFVVGIWRPTIVLPAAMTTRKNRSELSGIFAHELSHIQSSDLFWMAISQFLSMLLWFHPLSWRISNAQSLACEEVADAVAARNVGDARAYSRTLARVALAVMDPPPAVVAFSMARTPDIMARLSRLRQGFTDSPLAKRTLLAAAIAALLALAPIGGLEFSFAAPDDSAIRNRFDLTNGRVLHFPQGYSVGRLEIGLEKQSEEWDQNATRFDYRRDWNWVTYGVAQGDVTVPQDAKVKLTLKAEGAKETSWIRNLNPDDLYEIEIFNHPQFSNAFKFGDAQMKDLGHLTGLVELRMRYVDVSGRGLRRLQGLRSLEKLDIYSPEMGNDGLAAIGKLTSLQVLHMGKLKWTDSGLTHLRGLENLEEISFYPPGRPGKGFDTVLRLPKLKMLASITLRDVHLARLKLAKNLKALMLQQCEQISNNGLKHLAHVPNLEYLDFYHTNITDAGVEHLRPLQSLKRINLRVNRPPGAKEPSITTKSARVLAEIPSLEWVEFSTVKGGDDFLKEIAKLPNLQCLMIGGHRKFGMFTDAGCEHLSQLKKLDRLVISGLEVSEVGTESLAKLDSLRSVHLLINGMSNEAIANLSGLKRLEHLAISSGPKKGVAFSGLSELNGLTRLKSLTYYGQPPQPNDPPVDLSGLTQLEDIMISYLRDEDIASMANAVNMRRFQTFNQPTISDAAVEQLQKMKELEFLSIQGNGLTDATITQLAAFPHLRQLNLSGNFTDAALQRLAEYQGLGTIQLSTKNSFSDEALQEMQARLPLLTKLTVDQNRTGIGEKVKYLRAGRDAPDFEVKLRSGEKRTLNDYRGKVLLVYFWSTNCKPCVASVPKIKKAFAELKRYPDFEMLSLSGDVSDPILDQFTDQHKIPWPQARIGDDSKVARDYGVTGYPSYRLIGRDGKILSTGKDLDGALRSALEGKGKS